MTGGDGGDGVKGGLAIGAHQRKFGKAPTKVQGAYDFLAHVKGDSGRYEG